VPRPHTASATSTNTFESRQSTTMQGVFVVLADLDIGSNAEDAQSSERSSNNTQGSGNVNPDVTPMLIETLLQRSGAVSRANNEPNSNSHVYANLGQPLVFRLPPPGTGNTFAASTSRRSGSASNNETGVRPRNRSRADTNTQNANANTRESSRTLSSMLQRTGVAALHQTFRFGSTTATDSSTQTAATDSTSQASTQPQRMQQFIQRTLNHFSAEALITDFIRHAIEAHRSRGNPPASDFAINKLHESTIVEALDGGCIVCQDEMEIGAISLKMPCGHYFHRACLVPWLAEHNTCPICRCEIESNCPRYNQANYSKLKGELCSETISRHKSGGLSNFPEAPRIAQLQGRWLSSSDGIDASIMSGSGARSVRMTLRMPVASIGAALQAVRQNAINADRSGIAAEFFASQRIGAQPRQGHSDSPSGAVPPAASSTFDSIPNRNSEPSLSSQVGSRGRKRKADESVNEAPHVNAESSRRKRAYKRDKHLISQTDNVPHVWMVLLLRWTLTVALPGSHRDSKLFSCPWKGFKR